MIDYVDLDRHFFVIPEDFDQDDDYRHTLSHFLEDSLSWENLLKNRVTIILAEAGAGKTCELKRKAELLNSDSNISFFIDISELAEEGVQGCLGAEDEDKFIQWKSGAENGWFFLDSVDEARLIQPKNFERALKKFSKALAGNIDRAHVYISSRVSDWQAYYDRAMVADLLLQPVANTQQAVVYKDKIKPNNTNIDKVIVVGLRDLDPNQKRLLLKSQNGVNVEQLMTDIDSADAHHFTGRPLDLIDALNYWRRNKRIGHHAEMLKNNIESKLEEIKPERNNWQPLSKGKGLKGATFLAAALTLTRKKTIILPDAPIPPKRKIHSLEAQKILESWSPNEIAALLTRPIFDDATYGRIQFHHKSVREFLTAQWLIQLLRNGKQRRAVESILFANKYGCNLVVPALQPIAAWIALEDLGVRNRILKIAPEVLIAYGDPSQFSVEVRKKLLRFVVNLHDDKNSRLSFNASSLRRFANYDLHEEIAKLLKIAPKNWDIRHLLLELVEHGKISQCAKIALTYALNFTMDSTTRLVAIRAVAAAGSSKQKKSLSKRILSNPKLWGPRLTGSALFVLFPEYIQPEGLVQILQEFPEQSAHTSGWVELFMDKITTQPLQSEGFETILNGIIALLEEALREDREDATQTHQMGWLLKAAIKISGHILPKTGISESILRSLEIFAHHKYKFRHSVEIGLFSHLIQQHQDIRLTLFWRYIELKRKEHLTKNKRLTECRGIEFYYRFGQLAKEDFPLFIQDIVSKPLTDDKFVALTAALRLWEDHGLNYNNLESIRKASKKNPKLAEKLTSLLGIIGPHPLPEWQSKEKERNKKRKRQEAEQTRMRNERIKDLQSNFETLRDVSENTLKSKMRDFVWLEEEVLTLTSGPGQLGSTDWTALIPEFGEDVAHAFRDGLQACWRLYKPVPRSGRKNRITPLELNFGLAGLSIEAKTVPNWAKLLSEKEAALAALYAMCELNDFSWWADQLVEHHPSAFAMALQSELKWEFTTSEHEQVHSHVLSALSNSSEPILRLGRPMIFDFIEGREPESNNVMEHVLTILLSCTELDIERLQKIAKNRFQSTIDTDRKISWLIVLMDINASTAIPLFKLWLSQTASRQEADNIVIAFAAALFRPMGVRYNTVWRDYESTDAVVELSLLLHKHIRKADDQHHNGAFTPNQRDDAQSTRNYFPTLLARIPSRANFNALKRLAIEIEESKEWICHLCRKCIEEAAELKPWDITSVINFSEQGVGVSQSDQALFDMTVSRVSDLKLDLEQGDASFAPGLIQVRDETKYRLYFTERLRERALGLYSVAPEEEMADKKKPDIRIHAPSVNAPIPIEIKIADNWSYKELLSSLYNQLIGQYMRDDRTYYGVFLLVRKQKCLWNSRPSQIQITSFEDLIHKLQHEADNAQIGNVKVKDIKIIGIDLSKRIQPSGGQKV